MKYNLNQLFEEMPSRKSAFSSMKSLIIYVVKEKRTLIIAFVAMVITAILNLVGPLIIGHTIDKYIALKQYQGLVNSCVFLLIVYLVSFVAGYIQAKLMGSVGQTMLFTLRNAVFIKLQELPLSFFNQNKSGDLISRINNDTEKINQFFSQSLMQFIRFILIMLGAAIFLLFLNFELGAAALAPALGIALFTYFTSAWIKKRNTDNLQSTGALSSEIQESLNNFKVVVAFNRRDYFRKKFDEANQENYLTSLKAGIANNLFLPVYTFFSNIGQLIVLVFGIYLISQDRFTIGLLVSFLAYSSSFYNPLRQLAALWSSFQVAVAAWERVRIILNMESDMPGMTPLEAMQNGPLLSFKEVSFAYPGGAKVLHKVSFDLERGKTYAFVGPTGGGKTTTALLAARLYDPSSGEVLMNGIDIRCYTATDRTKRIGFILQEPLLFTGTVKENIVYGNEKYKDYNDADLMQVFFDTGLESLLKRFDKGFETKVDISGDGLSLGQKQLIAFMRAVLREPELLILDEATANIDTVTEQLLEEILQKLPASTTKIIIAHRLNTIENADEIFFVNEGNVARAGSFQEALNMLMQRPSYSTSTLTKR